MNNTAKKDTPQPSLAELKAAMRRVLARHAQAFAILADR